MRPMSTARARAPAFPEMPYASWHESLETIHRFSQVVGKIRLAGSPRRNHWWNVPFHLTGRGITTRPMGRDPIFCIDLDLLDHRLDIATVPGARYSFSLPGLSVANFYGELMHGLAAVGVDVDVARPYPFDLPGDHPAFADDTRHAPYDGPAVTRGWQVLSQVGLLLEEFAGRYSGKTSPVHHFWHSFDLAVTRFSERRVDQPVTADSVTREAYSRELISFGFWFGDPSFRQPAFYSYTAPEPEGLAKEPLAPAAAEWVELRGGHLAVLRYEDLRKATDPHQVVLEFYESAYQAGARLAGWDVARYTSPGGVTDPFTPT
jgi:hypothetical protein